MMSQFQKKLIHIYSSHSFIKKLIVDCLTGFREWVNKIYKMKKICKIIALMELYIMLRRKKCKLSYT